MCSDHDPDPHLKGQGHTRHLKVRVLMIVSALWLTYALMDYHLTWYKCCPHWEDVQWPWPGSIPQRHWPVVMYIFFGVFLWIHVVMFLKPTFLLLWQSVDWPVLSLQHQLSHWVFLSLALNQIEGFGNGVENSAARLKKSFWPTQM